MSSNRMTPNPTQLLDRIEAAIAQAEAQAAAATKRPWGFRDGGDPNDPWYPYSDGECNSFIEAEWDRGPDLNDHSTGVPMTCIADMDWGANTSAEIPIEQSKADGRFIAARANSADADYAYYRAQVAAIRGRLLTDAEYDKVVWEVGQHAVGDTPATRLCVLALHDAALADLQRLAQRWDAGGGGLDG